MVQIQAKAAAGGPQALVIFDQINEAVKVGLAQGIHNVFVLSVALMITGLIAVYFLKEFLLRGRRTRRQNTGEAVEDTAPHPMKR